MDGTTDATYTLGGSTDTWGRSWTTGELANGVFRAKFDKAASTDTLRLDLIQIKVYYQTATTTSSSTMSFIHTDHLNSTGVVTNDLGTTVQVVDYYPFGDPRIKTGTDVSQREFIGEHYDEESGLNYLNARYYESDRGQFLSQDPTFLAIGDPAKLNNITGLSQKLVLSDPQQLNSYAYARNNPVTYSDPEGEFVPVIILGALAFYGGYSAGTDLYEGYMSGDSGQFAWGAVGAAGSLIPGGGAAKGAASLADDAVRVGAQAVKNISVPAVGAGSRYMSEFSKAGYSSFNAFKRDYGSAGANRQWHHIVEQNSRNMSQFSAQAIHSPSNLVSLPTGVHQQITALYNTSVGGGQTFRDIVGSLSFDNQYKVGQAVVKAFTETAKK